MHGAPGFGIYGVDIFVKTDDAEKAVQLIKEINNQERHISEKTLGSKDFSFISPEM